MTYPVESRKLLYGVGINDAGYPIQKKGLGYVCPYYLKWRNMLQRCYCPKAKYNEGATVAKDWHKFSNFKLWVTSLGISPENLHLLHLDKDLLIRGNLIYSEYTCCFLHEKVNIFLNSVKTAKGVSWHKNRGYYVIQCKNPFSRKTEYLGKCKQQKDGFLLYNARKQSLAEELSRSEYVTDDKTREALLLYFKH